MPRSARFQCPDCEAVGRDRFFVSASALRMHAAAAHSKPSVPERPLVLRDDKPYYDGKIRPAFYNELGQRVDHHLKGKIPDRKAPGFVREAPPRSHFFGVLFLLVVLALFCLGIFGAVSFSRDGWAMFGQYFETVVTRSDDAKHR